MVFSWTVVYETDEDSRGRRMIADLIWHLRTALTPLTFTDDPPPDRPDPVAPGGVPPTPRHSRGP